MPKAEKMEGHIASYDVTPPASNIENLEETLENESLKNASEDDLANIVEHLLAEVSSLRSQVDSQEAMSPKWMTGDEFDGIEQDKIDYDPANIMAHLRERAADGMVDQMFFGTDSHAIPTRLLRRYGPKFKIGQRVQVNKEAIPWGHSGVTWGQLLSGAGSAGRGIVKKVIHLTDSGEWKYQVRVPGLTTAQGVGFQEHELLPIKQKVTRYVVEDDG